MHILIIPSEQFVTPKNPLGGIFQWHQALALKQAGVQVGVISSGFLGLRQVFKTYPYPKYEELEGIHIFRDYSRQWLFFRFLPIERQVQFMMEKGIVLFDKYISKFGKPDCIHAHNALYAGLLANKIYEKYQIPFVLTEHSSAFERDLIPKELIPIIAASLTNASVLLAVSSSFAKLLGDIFKKYRLNFEVLPNILDSFFFESISGKIDNGKIPFTFLNVASLDENKDHQNLINAFSIAFRDKNVRLRIGGNGLFLKKLQKQVIALEMTNQIKFLGLLDRKTVRTEMANADCFVLSSRYETFGVVLIEALACGTPVVATTCGGPEDIVDKSNGLLVPIKDSEKLAQAMLYIYNNYKLYDRCTIVKQAKLNYGHEAFINGAIGIYQNAIKNLKFKL